MGFPLYCRLMNSMKPRSLAFLIGLFLYSLLWGQEERVRLSIVSPSLIDFIVTAPNGKRTGADSRGPGVQFNEIPQSSYSYESYDGPPNLTVFQCTVSSPMNDGVYHLTVVGLKLVKYEVTIKVQPTQREQTLNTAITAVIDSGREQHFRFEYRTSMRNPFEAHKEVLPLTLAEDIAALQKIGYLSDSIFADSLLVYAHEVATLLDNNDLVAARSELRQLRSEIDMVHTPIFVHKHVTQLAYAMIREDIEALESMSLSGSNVK